MVKWKSCLASNEMFRVRILVELLRYGAGVKAAGTPVPVKQKERPSSVTLLPTWLDIARRRSCKPDDTGANPVVGSEVPIV
jgi:hypothetical protein